MIKKISIAAVIIAVLYVLFSAQNGETDERTSISVTGVQEKIENKEDIFLLDVRSQSEFEGELGHIEGSVLIPLRELEKRLNELKDAKEKEIIVICASGIRSDMAMRLLRENGFKACNMSGGLIAFRAMQKDKKSKSEEKNNEDLQ
jgi:rhodanese-related sulfurtransferase